MAFNRVIEPSNRLSNQSYCLQGICLWLKGKLIKIYKLIPRVYKECFISIYMVKHKMLVVNEDTKARLDEHKLCPRDSYNDVIARLINFCEETQI